MIVISGKWMERIWYANKVVYNPLRIYRSAKVDVFKMGYIREKVPTYVVKTGMKGTPFIRRLKKSTAYRWRKCQRKGVVFQPITDSSEFTALFSELKKERGLKGPENFPRPRLGGWKNYGVYQKGKLLAGCSIAICQREKTALVFFQTSAFRKYKDPKMRRICSDASVMMFCELVGKLREMKVELLDFGGPDPVNKGLAEFKEQFPGRYVIRTNYIPWWYRLLTGKKA